jgi:hypothetical protein
MIDKHDNAVWPALGTQQVDSISTSSWLLLYLVQVELLLTFEEYCSEEEVFEGQGEHGKAFGDIFDLVGAYLTTGLSVGSCCT